jgi:hypothetical protein
MRHWFRFEQIFLGENGQMVQLFLTALKESLLPHFPCPTGFCMMTA